MSDQRPDGTKGEARLDDCREQIADLSRRLKTAVGTEAEALRPKLKAAEKRLAELKETSAEAWEDLKPGLRRAWKELHDSLNQASSRFKTRPKE